MGSFMVLVGSRQADGIRLEGHCRRMESATTVMLSAKAHKVVGLSPRPWLANICAHAWQPARRVDVFALGWRSPEIKARSPTFEYSASSVHQLESPS